MVRQIRRSVWQQRMCMISSRFANHRFKAVSYTYSTLELARSICAVRKLKNWEQLASNFTAKVGKVSGYESWGVCGKIRMTFPLRHARTLSRTSSSWTWCETRCETKVVPFSHALTSSKTSFSPASSGHPGAEATFRCRNKYTRKLYKVVCPFRVRPEP